jgi:hypothetical protein
VNARRILLPILLATACTALNAGKAPLIDDTAYLTLTRHIAKHPLDPYGFEQFWYQHPEPANHILAPPVQPYWLALGMRVLGDRPVAWKMWLFPEMLLLAFSLQALFRRFARGAEAPLLVATFLSPALLPAWNFMLDLPALALSTTALVLFLRALEQKSVLRAILAGAAAGLATQTKYTGLLILPLFVGAAAFAPIPKHRAAPSLLFRVMLTVLGCAIAGLMFAGWEALVERKYGESHFLVALGTSEGTWKEKLLAYLGKWRLLLWMLILSGGLLPPAAILGFVGFWKERRWLLLVPVTILLGAYVALILIPIRESIWIGQTNQRPVASWIFGSLGGLSIFVLFLVIARQVLRLSRFSPFTLAQWLSRLRWSRSLWFLLFWLLIETAGFLAMTPFPACRRLIGFTIVATLLAGRFLSRTCRTEYRKRIVWLAVIPGVILGVFYAGIDLADSWREPLAVREASQFIRQRDPAARIWFVGHWGFQFEAERQGMKPLNPDYTELQPGDWLIVPNADSVHQQIFQPETPLGEPVAHVTRQRVFPLRTIPAYYGGHLPMERGPDPSIDVPIYRVSEKWVPRTE